MFFRGICNNLGLFYEENERYQDSIKWRKSSGNIGKLENNQIQKAVILSNMW